MVEHALQRLRVQHLKEQTANTARHHAHQVGMHHADRRIFGKQRVIRRWLRFLTRRAVIEDTAHLIDQFEPQ